MIEPLEYKDTPVLKESLPLTPDDEFPPAMKIDPPVPDPAAEPLETSMSPDNADSVRELPANIEILPANPELTEPDDS